MMYQSRAIVVEICSKSFFFFYHKWCSKS